MSASIILNLIHDLRLEQKQKNSQQNLACVFDLDSTLFNLNQRQLQIFKEFASVPANQKLYPAETHALANMGEEHLTYYPEDCIQNFSPIEIAANFSADFNKFWRPRFFSADYLKYDVLEPGARELIQSLRQLNTDIFFLTGRDEARMGHGTRTQLQQSLGLRPQQIHSELILKPHLSMLDDQFKLEIVRELSANYFAMLFIDNEELNLEVIHKELNNIKLVLFDSFHSGKGKAPTGIPVIKNFI